MGYQNNNRPRNIKRLATDISFDMSDLCEDAKLFGAHPQLLDGIKFVQESFSRYRRSIERNYVRKANKRNK